MDTDTLLKDLRNLGAKLSSAEWCYSTVRELEEMCKNAKHFADLFRDLDMLITNDKTLPEAWKD